MKRYKMEEHNFLEMVALTSRARRSLGAAFCDMHPHIQAFWEPIWKRTLGKSQTNAASATLFPLVQAFWTNIWQHTVTKKGINATSVNMPSLRQAIWGDIWTHTHWRKSNKCRLCNFVSSYSNTLNRHLKTHSGGCQINATDVNKPSFRQAIWRGFWKYTVANS